MSLAEEAAKLGWAEVVRPGVNQVLYAKTLQDGRVIACGPHHTGGRDYLVLAYMRGVNDVDARSEDDA